MHFDNKKNILVLGKGPTQRSDDTTTTAEGKYPINCTTRPGRGFVLRLHYHGSNSFLFVHAVKICQFKAKYPLCLGNIDNMKETRLKGYVYVFSTDFNFIDTNDILNIHKYFMKITKYKTKYYLDLLKKLFNGLTGTCTA